MWDDQLALDRILSILPDDPSSSRELASTVANFFGRKFRHKESATFDASRTEINLRYAECPGASIPPIPALEYAGVRLKTGTRRTVPALVHELLHLERCVLGQPVLDVFDAPSAFEPFFPEILPAYGRLVNVVDHEIMLPRFRSLGFPTSDFLGAAPASVSNNYSAAASRGRDPSRPDAIGRLWWAHEYFRHWISVGHGVPAGAALAADALANGRRIYSELPDLAAKLRAWVERGEFRVVANYAASMDDLYAILEIPRVARWLRLEPSEDGPQTVDATPSVAPAGPSP